MANIVIKQFDTYPPLETVLKSTIFGGELVPIDLTTATTVKIVMKNGAEKLTGTCTFPSPKTGNVIYKWPAYKAAGVGVASTEKVGLWKVEWQVTFAEGVESVPNENFDEIEIQAGL